ncbi:MAG: TonB-dependent receptor [Chitinophagaceae bacterium]|nr:TonB-dependent receptor [Chitinophagaceae bacterium]
MKKKIFIAAAVLFSSQVQAQRLVPVTSGDSTKNLDEVVITATKTIIKQSETGKVISVISKEQIEQSSGKSVAQVLNEQAGITVNGVYNAAGSVQTVFSRGASSGRTLILIDGIPAGDPSMINGEFDLNLFSINDVERIEICRGAQSTLYGSDAIGGVINIITVKRDIDRAFHVKATAAFGSKSTFRGNLQLYGKTGNLVYTARYAKLSTKGFSAAYDSSGTKDFDNDGYDGNALSAQVKYQVIPALSVKTFIQYSQYTADIDAGVFADEKDYAINNNTLSSGFAVHFKKGIVNMTGNYQYRELKRSYLNDSLDTPGFTTYEDNKYNGRTQFAELYGSMETSKWLTVLIGGDYRWAAMHQKYYSESMFGPYDPPAFDSSLHQTSFYASLFFSALNKKLHVEIGGRTNNHSRYGNNTTFTFNPSFTINKNWRVFGSIASGFKAPSIYQVFDSYSGNPDLQPEKSVNYELGIQQSHEKLSSRLIYFHRDINNGIDYDYVNFQYVNLVKQSVDGLELELSVQPVKNVSITANYTLITGKEETQSRKSTKDSSYNYLLRRPKNSFNLNLGYRFTKAFFASVSAKAVGDRYDVGGYQQDDVKLNKYFLLSAYAEYKCKNHFKFFLDAQNITNKKFFDLRGYNAAPFMLNGGITFSW